MNKLLSHIDDMAPEERDKLRSMLRENKDKKDECVPLDWMYKSEKPDTEEYLLGRRIDHHIDKEEEQDPSAPGALFAEAVARRADIDMHAKMREDPLFAIRKKEEDAKRKLLQNPIKMKQLQEMMERAKGTKKKHKKEKKRHRRKSSSESDRDVSRKYQTISHVTEKKKKKKKKKKHKDQNDSSDSGDDILGKYLEILKEKKSKKQIAESAESSVKNASVSHGRKRHDSSSDSDTERITKHSKFPPGYGLIRGNKERSPYKTSSTDKHSRRSPKRKSGSPRRKSRSPVREKSRSRKEEKRKLTADDKERVRQQMMADASWRDEQREKNVKRYKEEDAKEVEDTYKGSSSDFINPLILKHAASSSVEDRIKRNRYNIQRNSSSMTDNSYVK